MKESHKRTFVKTISWRLIATLTTMLIVWLFVKDVGVTVLVGSFEIVVKLIVYYLHERAWNFSKWGIKN